MDKRQDKRQAFVRINNKITAPQVRLVTESGTRIISSYEAKQEAFKAGLDLVEIVQNANPPVVKIMDFGKWRYEQKQKLKEDSKKNKAIKPKEIRMRYCIAEHDADIKSKALERFLKEGRQVKLVVRFKKGEQHHREEAAAVLMNIAAKSQEFGEVQSKPRMDGKRMVLCVIPR